jgi:hypothetical protein
MKSKFPFMRRIQIVLSKQGTGYLFTLISIIAINAWQQVLGNFDYDNSFTIAAAKNISNGHGYTIQTASTEDLSKFYYDPLNRWPPGYSWLLVAAHWLFSTDWIHASFILNAIGLTLLVLVFRNMLLQLEFPEWIVNVTVLYYGFLFHPFHFSYFSDIFGLLFFLFGLVIMIKGIKSDQHVVIFSILSAFFIGGAAYMKYLYIPLSFVPLVSLFIYGYSSKRMDLQSAAVNGFLFLFLIIGSLLLFQFHNSGHAIYINPSKTGFYPNQLFRMAPVIPLGLLNLTFINVQLNHILHVSFENLNVFWKLINLFCIGWLIFTSYKLIRRGIFRIRDFRGFYAILVCMFTIVLFSFLAVLSVIKNKHYTDTFFDWVYGQELRYYGVFIVFILQFVIFLFVKQKYFFSGTVQLIFRSVIGFILLIELTHGAYFCIKKILIEKEYGLAISSDQYLFKSMELTRTAMTENKNLVVCSNNYAIVNMCSLENVPIYCDMGKLQKPLNNSLPVSLLIAVDTTVPGISVPLLSDPVVKPDYIFRNVSYYFVDLPKTANF